MRQRDRDSVLGAEVLFTSRKESAHVNFAVALGWNREPALAARELVSIWTGLERQWAMNPAIDFMVVWNHFADRFFVREW